MEMRINEVRSFFSQIFFKTNLIMITKVNHPFLRLNSNATPLYPEQAGSGRLG